MTAQVFLDAITHAHWCMRQVRTATFDLFSPSDMLLIRLHCLFSTKVIHSAMIQVTSLLTMLSAPCQKKQSLQSDSEGILPHPSTL